MMTKSGSRAMTVSTSKLVLWDICSCSAVAARSSGHSTTLLVGMATMGTPIS